MEDYNQAAIEDDSEIKSQPVNGAAVTSIADHPTGIMIEPERIELGFIERIAAATLLARSNQLEARKQQLEKDIAELSKHVIGMADEVFKRIGQTRNPDTVYLLTPDAFVKQ